MLSFHSRFAIVLVLWSCAASTLLDEMLPTGFKIPVDCVSCHAALVELQALAMLGNSVFVDTMVGLCDTLHLADPDVCQGAISQQGPIVADDLRHISALGQTSTLLCNALFGLCQAPPINPYNVSFPSAAPVNPKVWKSLGKTPFQVFHLTDVHIDRQYTVGSEANCTKPLCCRNFTSNMTKPTVPAAPNGEPKCDSPVSLAESMLEFTQKISEGVRFSIFTGDVVEGMVWLVNKSEVTSDLQDFNDEMAAKLQTPVFPTFGNHDVAPVNYFPRNTTSTANQFQWVFDTQSAGWKRWVGDDAASQVKYMSGCYSILVPGMNLRVISINTQYWYNANFGLYDSDASQPDPNGILAFLVEALQATEDAGQRAWIIGHVPPGHVDTMHDQSNYYNQIIQRYKNSIAGQFFGHSHKDQFEIAYSDYDNQDAATAVSWASIGPALTPTSGNPAFKVYDIDPDTFEVMDVKVYSTNTSDPNFETTPTWELYYSARNTYGSLVPSLTVDQSLSAAFWHNLTEVFASNDTAFQMYNTFLSRGGAVGACDGTCKNTTICGLRAMRAENNCDVVTAGIPFANGYSMTSTRAYDLGFKELGSAYILQQLNISLSSGSISLKNLVELWKQLESIVQK